MEVQNDPCHQVNHFSHWDFYEEQCLQLWLECNGSLILTGLLKVNSESFSLSLSLCTCVKSVKKYQDYVTWYKCRVKYNELKETYRIFYQIDD